jgi:hypothetical protein
MMNHSLPTWLRFTVDVTTLFWICWSWNVPSSWRSTRSSVPSPVKSPMPATCRCAGKTGRAFHFVRGFTHRHRFRDVSPGKAARGLEPIGVRSRRGQTRRDDQRDRTVGCHRGRPAHRQGRGTRPGCSKDQVEEVNAPTDSSVRHVGHPSANVFEGMGSAAEREPHIIAGRC